MKRRSTWALVAAPVLAVAGMAVATAGPATAHVTTGRASTTRWVMPNKHSEVDCNAWSTQYKAVNPGFRAKCVDPHGKIGNRPWVIGGKSYANGRFIDNGHYVGHDEPSVKFISSAAKSGNTMTYYMKLPVDPAAAATNDGKVVDYGELSPAPWFGLAMCDPRSYPQNPCTPDSDSNKGAISNPADAGSAFMELQFYPPKFAPFADSLSCAAGYWCAAMTIDSLESKFNFAALNLHCEEPVNFAYLQTNGKPTGPPSPQLTDFQTFTPNAHTLRLHDGDLLRVSISDPARGFTTAVTDLTTGRTGYMVASAKNGFMDTNYKSCAGTPHTFHAEYNTAAQKNQVPWAALEGGVLMEQEIGHSEVCSSLSNADPFSGVGVSDPNTMATCNGGMEGQSATGEGPCNFNTGACTNSTTEGTTPGNTQACPIQNFGSPELCEYSDGTCLPQGSRPVTLNGVPSTEISPVNFCQDNQTQNGDLDFDGVDYQSTTWPNGSANVPTSIRYVGPFTATGKTYPKVQFETDAAGSEFLCNTFTGLNCDAPPLGAAFYPYWTLTSTQGLGGGLFRHGCVWNFGNTIPGITTQAFGGDAQYGAPDVARYGGTIITPTPIANPEVSGKCRAL